jgi:hydroxyethylthiazole kinase-like uncharacterized protein yjeF
MRVVTAAEMQEIDRRTIAEYGIPGTVLMGLAGRSCAEYVLNFYGEAVSISVCCGGGNNGGDGFVIAWLLRNAGKKVTVYFTGNKSRLSDESIVYCNLCQKLGVDITVLSEDDCSGSLFNGSDLIVDALLGTGFSGTPRGTVACLISEINASGLPVVSVDIPSGLPAQGPVVECLSVKASDTVTIGLPKINTVTFPGKEYVGNLSVADIGFPAELTAENDQCLSLIDKDFCIKHLPFYDNSDTHKGERGHLLLIGGFDGMEGAIMLAAMAALAMGVGLITCITTDKARSVIAGKIPELITLGLPDYLERAEKDDIYAAMENCMSGRRYDAVVTGPGMGRSLFAGHCFRAAVNTADKLRIGKVLIDGDGLYHSAHGTIPAFNGDLVLTPHFMEASRLMECTVDTVKADRLACARLCAESYGAVTVLKGPASIIADQNGCAFVNTTGNSALATAGSGDVLSGIIGALLLDDISSLHAAACGVSIHGLAADCYRNNTGRSHMQARDIITGVSEVLSGLY